MFSSAPFREMEPYGAGGEPYGGRPHGPLGNEEDKVPGRKSMVLVAEPVLNAHICTLQRPGKITKQEL